MPERCPVCVAKGHPAFPSVTQYETSAVVLGAENNGDYSMEAYHLTRSKRKSLSIIIGKDGTIQVKAPNWLPKYKIDQFIQQKADWIQEKQREISMLEQQKPVHTFREGDCFLFQGETYRLTLGSGNRHKGRENRGSAKAAESAEFSDRKQFGRTYRGIALEESEKLFIMEPGLETDASMSETGPGFVRERIEEWYLFQAKQIFPERVSQYYPLVSRLAGSLGKEIGPVNRISIRNQKTRWGSCSSKGNLNFNWRLVMAPAGILDYVVIHELCHLAYLNHSSQFWHLVSGILPDWKERRSWLKANGPLLEWENF